MSTYSSNVTTKVNRAISGATTVNPNCYAVVTYLGAATAPSYGGSQISTVTPIPITRYFGPGQSVPSSFVTNYLLFTGSTDSQNTITWSLASGVEFANTP